MGWGSAVDIFDTVVKEVKKNLDEIEKDWVSETFPKKEFLVRIVEPLARELEDGDWDTQQESDYFEELKWDVFPDIAADIEEEKRLYGD